MSLDNILISAKGHLAPYKYPKFYKFWDDMRNKNYWSVDRINFTQDKNDFDSLPKDEQYCIKYLLASFAINELNIGRSWAGRALSVIQNEEIQLALGEIVAQESGHSVAYQKLAESLNILEELNSPIFQTKAVKERTSFLDSQDTPLITNIVVSSLFGEAVALFTTFFLLGDFTRRTGKLCGLNDVNMYSWKDEFTLPSSHVNIAKEILQILGQDPDSWGIKEMIKESVEQIEVPFINSIPLPESWSVTHQDLIDYAYWRATDEGNMRTCPQRMLAFENMIRGVDVNAFFERKGSGTYAKDNYVDDY